MSVGICKVERGGCMSGDHWQTRTVSHSFHKLRLVLAQMSHRVLIKSNLRKPRGLQSPGSKEAESTDWLPICRILRQAGDDGGQMSARLVRR